MIEIRPAILAKDESEFRAKVEKVRALGLALHIDVMDGKFVPQTTWAPPERMREIIGDLPFEAHLMVADPDAAVPFWFLNGAERVIFHAEAETDHVRICHDAGDRCLDLSLAINPPTDLAEHTATLDDLQHVMVMGVTPGMSGQPFQPVAFDKIRALKKAKPTVRIAIDGGVKPSNAAALAAAGVDVIIAGSALTDQDDPAAALEEFRKAVSGV